MSAIPYRRMSLGETLRSQGRILVALMLRDVRARFFGNAAGMIIAIGWPLSHIFILLAINMAAGRSAPYGDSTALWLAAGLVPFQAFSYMSRFTMMGIAMNRPLLGFPVVKVMDVLIARGAMELLNATVVTLISMFILLLMGVDFTPNDPVQAVAALGASMLLGFGFGAINGIIAGMFSFWVTGYALFAIVMWIASGVILSPEGLPETAQYWLSFNPALQGVIWMRSAYYEGYAENMLDKGYMISFSVAAIFLALGLERVVRGRILQ